MLLSLHHPRCAVSLLEQFNYILLDASTVVTRLMLIKMGCITLQVHRDIKPENILVVRSYVNKGITVKIADFGTATWLSSSHNGSENGSQSQSETPRIPREETNHTRSGKNEEDNTENQPEVAPMHSPERLRRRMMSIVGGKVHDLKNLLTGATSPTLATSLSQSYNMNEDDFSLNLAAHDQVGGGDSETTATPGGGSKLIVPKSVRQRSISVPEDETIADAAPGDSSLANSSQKNADEVDRGSEVKGSGRGGESAPALTEYIGSRWYANCCCCRCYC